jgi:tetratricopeptide (TPR) repeat protein
VLKEIERVPAALRRAFDIQVAEIVALDAVGDNEREIAALEQLAVANPDNEKVWITLGEALSAVGRNDEAVAALREALRRRPTCGEAYWALSNFKTFRFPDSDLSAMRRALKRNPAPEDAMTLHFALGKALEDRGNYQQSFRHYAAANATHPRANDPSVRFTTPWVDSGIATLTPQFFEQRQGVGVPDPSPIFVVGMHRAGSTLVEQILASHPMIEGTTEIKVMEKIANRLWRDGTLAGRSFFEQVAGLDARALADLGREYLDRSRAFRTTELPFFVDKLPPNWLRVGLIRLVLPNARIIDARRHPMACGFSNFKQHYRAENPFAYSQESIGTFYRDYWRFMTHFEEVQPGAVHRVINEKLIDDPEGEIRRMLDYLGVPFDPACLEFHKNKRAIRTPSAEQVRRPINRDGVDVWKNYEPWLGPLKAALGPALERWDD